MRHDVGKRGESHQPAGRVDWLILAPACAIGEPAAPKQSLAGVGDSAVQITLEIGEHNFGSARKSKGARRVLINLRLELNGIEALLTGAES